MDYFQYKNNKLYCENMDIEEIVKKVKTPAYIYSFHTLTRHFNVFDKSFSKIKHITCYSVKANSNLSILNIFKTLGSGFDIVSGGELYRVLKINGDSQKVVYSGVGKTPEEIEFALKNNILLFNVESFDELFTINSIGEKLNKKAPVALRVNPDVDPKTHPYISTGLKENKFGIDIKYAIDWYKQAKELKFIDIVGVDCHIGSQLTEISPFVDAIKKVKNLILQLNSIGIKLKYIDIGGGLGVRYKDENPPAVEDYANAIINEIKDLNLTLILEPGRVIVANAGILITKILYIKKNENKNFIIVDAGMNDLVRPSLYKAYQEIIPLNRANINKIKADIVGPICESGDFMAKDRVIEYSGKGSYLAIRSAGAYGFTMTSNYNSRPRPCEILVKDDKYYVIRERETYEDLIRKEKIITEVFNEH